MKEGKALNILGDAINPDNSLKVRYEPSYLYVVSFGNKVQLDGEYTPEELEAIVWWMKNKKEA